MGNRIRRSWRLTTEAWQVLQQDRLLILFPILSGLALTVLLATFLVPAALLIPWSEIFSQGSEGRQHLRFRLETLHYVGVFLGYLVGSFVVIFFNVGLVACVRKRFAGETPTIRDGLGFAAQNVGRIFQWALVNATVGVVLQAIGERAGWLARLAADLIGFAWSLATFFVVPVLVYEQVGPFDALKRSAETFRKTWGESLTGHLGIGIAFGLLAAGGVVATILGVVAGFSVIGSSTALGFTVVGISLVGCVLYLTVLGVLQSTLQSIFLAACYQYATTGAAPYPFTREYVAEAWPPRTR
jgi:hypothetical protein